MLCRIKKIKKTEENVGNDVYFVKFLFFNDIISKKSLKKIKIPVCDWTDDKILATIFKTKKEAERKAKKYHLKNIEYERVN